MRLLILFTVCLLSRDCYSQIINLTGKGISITPARVENKPDPVPPVKTPETPKTPEYTPKPKTRICQCQGSKRSVCYCLKANVKCGCHATKGSEWILSPLQKTGRYFNPLQQLKTSPTRESRKVYLFTASWCGPCQAIKATLPSLQEIGWKVGTGESNHIQIVDIDKNPELWQRYSTGNSIPLAVLVSNGKIVDSLIPSSANEISYLYYRVGN